MKDYVCIAMWDTIFECMRYHWVHKKDLFRKDEGDIVPAYREILDRLQPLTID